MRVCTFLPVPHLSRDGFRRPSLVRGVRQVLGRGSWDEMTGRLPWSAERKAEGGAEPGARPRAPLGLALPGAPAPCAFPFSWVVLGVSPCNERGEATAGKTLRPFGPRGECPRSRPRSAPPPSPPQRPAAGQRRTFVPQVCVDGTLSAPALRAPRFARARPTAGARSCQRRGQAPRALAWAPGSRRGRPGVQDHSASVPGVRAAPLPPASGRLASGSGPEPRGPS